MLGKKVLVTSTSFARVDDAPIRLLREAGWEVVPLKGPFSDEELASRLVDFDAVIVGNDLVGPATLRAAKKLRVIVEHGTGVDNIDLEAAKAAGIAVRNTPHTNAAAVAEYVFAGLLSLLRHVEPARRSLREGAWAGSSFAGAELFGKTMGVVGLGHIGRLTARIARGFSMDVMYHDLVRHDDAEKDLGLRFSALADLLRQSDVVVLHIPLVKETAGLIGKDELALMKPTAFLVNVSRGGVVREDALHEALSCQRLAGAVIDVFETEPPAADNPLLALDTVICTPHLAGYTKDALIRTSMMAAEKLLEAAEGAG